MGESTFTDKADSHETGRRKEKEDFPFGHQIYKAVRQGVYITLRILHFDLLQLDTYCTMDIDIPLFTRREVQHDELNPTTPDRNTSKRFKKRRGELERDIHDRLRENKQERGYLRSHSIFLE